MVAWILLAFTLAACVGSGGEDDHVGAEIAASDRAADLSGTSWQLVRIQSMDDTTVTPDDPAKYTISFGADGMVSVRADCNRGRGAWSSPGTGQLELGPLATTRAFCPPGSLHDRFVRDLGYVRSYTFQDGRLYLSLLADGGIYEFEPIAP